MMQSAAQAPAHAERMRQAIPDHGHQPPFEYRTNQIQFDSIEVNIRALERSAS